VASDEAVERTPKGVRDMAATFLLSSKQSYQDAAYLADQVRPDANGARTIRVFILTRGALSVRTRPRPTAATTSEACG
jgi:hypothetical protein